MVEIFGDDDDCWEWFQADKDQILRSLKRKHATDGRQAQQVRRSNFRHRRVPSEVAKISTKDLEEINNLQPLGMFLYLETETKPDFYVDQIGPNDDMERVLVYTRILVTLCELELPGFHYDMLSKVAACTPLLEQYEDIVRKLCTKSFRTMWTDLKRVDRIICHMQTILLQAQRAGVLDKSAMQILFNIWLHLKNNNNPSIEERPVCMEFLQQLHSVFSVDQDVLAEPNPAAEVSSGNLKRLLYFTYISMQIYPSLDELQEWLHQPEDAYLQEPKLRISYVSTTQYINSQRLLLRQQFVLPLRQLVRMLHQRRNMAEVKPLYIAFEQVQIKLNMHFPDAHSSKLLFVDLLAPQRRAEPDVQLDEADASALLKLKSGALLCLSTGYDFKNLILATVVSTDVKQQRRGYIAITIVRQFNIGNIYGKTLIMFETPAYFEPYSKAYRYLSNSNVINFPMSDYIVHGLMSTQRPAYLNQTQPPNVYESQKFANKLRKMPLNSSQLEAFRRVLKTNFNLIQGPPGTGKTHLSLQLVKTMLEHAKLCAPIVVIAYTNDSLDKFLLKLSSYTDSIVRFGCQSRLPEIAKFNARADTNRHMINARLKRLYWMVNLEIKQHFKHLQSLYVAFNNTDKAYADILAIQRLVWNAQEKLNCIRMIFQHYLIVKKNVVAMTTTCAARFNFVFRFLKSRIVIFEEAAEILEAHVLPCLTPYTEHVIMIGDHKQLKPATTYIKELRNSSITQSLFERLIRADFHVNVLNIQYRMRNTLADMLCPLFYKKLFSHESVYKFPPVRHMSQSVYFLEHQEPETQVHNTFLKNDSEVLKACEIVRYLLDVSGYKSKQVVVLSPYSMQVDSIKKKLAPLKDVGVFTVDSFQGLEADIVVLSLVRSNARGNIGFLSEENRICVAISRARYGLYVIGNMRLLSQCSSAWAKLRDKFKQLSAIGSEFPYENNNNNAVL
ncbi:hypothetical protein KR222_006366 [Zaprionus bogoriensis]|nr:hypothetical protein KR222_006366 [Zaprionus bogoriensis]